MVERRRNEGDGRLTSWFMRGTDTAGVISSPGCHAPPPSHISLSSEAAGGPQSLPLILPFKTTLDTHFR